MCWHLPICPGRHQPSIFGTTELNFRVRDGNGWTLSAVSYTHLGSVYQVGIYALLAVQAALILARCAGICMRDEPKSQEPPIDFKRDTMELPIAEIDQILLDEDLKK